jgi:general secretion pathway protein N
MKISWRLVAVGVGAYVIFLLVTLPASFVLPRLQPRGIHASAISGTIWNGSAGALQIGGMSLGAAKWRINFLPLLVARLSADVRLERDSGSIQATIGRTLGGKTKGVGLRGTLPMAALGGFGLPGGWQGDVKVDIAEFELNNNWPTRAVGTIEAINLVGPAHQPTALGNYRVEFGRTAAADGGLNGSLSSTGDDGPFDVVGSLRLLPNRTYVIDAQVATRPSAPASVTKALQYLGPPDSQGRRPLSISGSL